MCVHNSDKRDMLATRLRAFPHIFFSFPQVYTYIYVRQLYMSANIVLVKIYDWTALSYDMHEQSSTKHAAYTHNQV